jgi:hypothetical protein
MFEVMCVCVCVKVQVFVFTKASLCFANMSASWKARQHYDLFYCVIFNKIYGPFIQVQIVLFHILLIEIARN